jgi:hypothetical protein
VEQFLTYRVEIRHKDEELAQTKFRSKKDAENSESLARKLDFITESNVMLANEKEMLERKEGELHQEVEELFRLKSQYEQECEELKE